MLHDESTILLNKDKPKIHKKPNIYTSSLNPSILLESSKSISFPLSEEKYKTLNHLYDDDLHLFD